MKRKSLQVSESTHQLLSYIAYVKRISIKELMSVVVDHYSYRELPQLEKIYPRSDFRLQELAKKGIGTKRNPHQ